MNENKLAVFSNPDFGEVRTLEINGEPWFVLADVCRALGLSTPSRVAERLEDDEKGVSLTHTLGGAQNLTIINESGLYSVILRSDKPQAKPFRKWVTSEVLPSIRKTGAYTVNTNAVQKKDDRELDAMLMDANARLLEAKAKQAAILLEFTKLNLSPEANQALVACASELMTGVKALPLPEVEKTYSAGEVGEMFGVSGNRIGRIANAKGLKTEKYGIFVLDKAKGSNKQVQTFRYNQAAVDFFREYFEEDE